MTSPRAQRAARRAVILILVAAVAMLIWSFAAGVDLAIESSVPGGLAIMLVAVIMLPLLGWRIRYQWQRLHQISVPDNRPAPRRPDS